MPSNDGGLGEHLVGDKIPVGERNLQVVKLLGEGRYNLSVGSLFPSYREYVAFTLLFPNVCFFLDKVVFRMST